MIRRIQILLKQLFGNDRAERLVFLSSFLGRNIVSVKDLTEEEQLEIIQFLSPKKVAYAKRLQEELPDDPKRYKGLKVSDAFYGSFDVLNKQHRTVLARCYELGWTTYYEGKIIVDIARLGAFIRGRKSPVKKPLRTMNKQEISQLIFVLEKMIKQHYNR